MKIVCDACQAKYSISDDKVQGKVFKIRCKKCSNIIVVRGGAGGAEAAAAPAKEEHRTYEYGYDGGGDQAPAGDDAVWHVVINQDQVGPMTAAEVQQRFSAGEIDADTYIWREGFADWLPIAQVDTFAGFVASGSSTAAVGGGGGAAVAAMFSSNSSVDEAGTVRSDPGDLFAAASSSAHTSEDDGDLFGSKPSKAASAPASASSASSKLRGERNENSVLFSLGNLAQLASDKPAPVTAAPSSAGHATGAAGGEGSGLIDIRSMASAYLGGGSGAAKPATSSAIGSIDDLPVFGGGGFSEPAVIVPTPARNSNSKLMYALIGSVGLLAVAAVILVVVLMKGDKEPAKVAAAGDPTEKKDDKVEAKAADPTTDKPADTTKPEDKPADTTKPEDKPVDTAGTNPEDTKPADTAKPEDKPADKKDKPAVKPKDRGTAATIARTETKPKDKPAEKPVESKDQAACDEVSCVLNNYEGACCAKFKKSKGGSTASKSASGGGGDLPDSLTRELISEGVSKVKARVMACGDKSSAKGQVKVSVKVNPDGSVANVTVKTTPDPGLGSCVQSAMQKASFKKTQNGGSFGYPFVF